MEYPDYTELIRKNNSYRQAKIIVLPNSPTDSECTSPDSIYISEVLNTYVKQGWHIKTAYPANYFRENVFVLEKYVESDEYI